MGGSYPCSYLDKGWAAVGGGTRGSCYAIEATGARRRQKHTTGSPGSRPIGGENWAVQRCHWSVAHTEKFHIFQRGMRVVPVNGTRGRIDAARCDGANTPPASNTNKNTEYQTD